MQWEQEGGGKGGTDNLNVFPRGSVNQREAFGGIIEGNKSSTTGFCLLRWFV